MRRLLHPLTLLIVVLAACGSSSAGSGPSVSTVATGLRVPWQIAFLPDGGALITERPGRVVKLTAQRRIQTVAHISVVSGGENGLRGEQIRRVRLRGSRVVLNQALFAGVYGRIAPSSRARTARCTR